MRKKIIGISPRFWSNETQEYVRVGTQYTNQLQREDIIPFIIVESVNLCCLVDKDIMNDTVSQ